MSPSIKRRRRNILLLFTRKSLPTQTRAYPSTEAEDTSLSINRSRRNILLLFTRKSLPTQTRAPPSTEEEEIFYFASLENLCPPRHELIHQQKQKKYSTSLL